MFKFSFLTVVHQNSTCGAAENIGTATKPNGIMHEPVRADRPNAFSNNSSSVLSCIQTTVDILSQTAGPSTFELPDHTLVGPGHEGGVRVGKKNFMDLRKSPHGHSKKVHPKKYGRDSSRDLSVPVLIRTIRRLTKKKYLDDKSQIKDAVRMAEVITTLHFNLCCASVAIAKYISSPPMSDTNLKVLHKMSGLSAKALVVLPCYVSLEVGQFVIAKLATRRKMGDEGLLLEIFNKFVNELKEKEHKRQEDKYPYIEMMKNNFIFFQSSTNDANKTPPPPLKSKEVSSWRSVSLSSGSFYDSGSGKKNFMNLSKSPHGYSKKVHPKKYGRDSSRDLSVPVLIRTIRRLTKKKAELDSQTRRLKIEKNELQLVLEKELDRRFSDWSLQLKKYQIEQHRLCERARELAEQNVSLQREVSSFNKKEVDNRIKMLFSEKHLEDLSKRIEQVSEENQNLMQQLTQLQEEYRVLKNEENINQLTNDLQECMKELGIVKAILPKVFQQRDFMWEEVKSYSEMNMLLNYEINILKRKVDTLDEDFLIKEDQITILKDSIGKPFDLLASPDSLLGALHLGLLYVGSLVVLLVYSILYGLTTKESNWLGATTSAAMIILDWNLGACLYSFKLLKSRVVVLYVAGTSRVFLICFGVHYWYFGHFISYAVVVSVLLGATVSRHLSVTDPLAARRDALQSTVIRLREGFYREDQNSSASSFEGCGSSVKRSSSTDAGHLGNATVPCTVVQEPEVGSSYVDRNLEHNSSLVVCSSSGLESQGGDSSTSTSTNQQILDLNLALVFQENLSDPRVTSMLKRKERLTDCELANLLQDKGLDPNFAVMLKENGLDPMILSLL
ncbi:hypothetical protein T459_28854 [Capsicum annuum]|uniref:Calpain-type cysteine protease DEK1 n=1 Tax=Capsicum annuum TaxID=4072 RepID=A0A2G2YI01_CAPAN|nr:hypothetical protein T459_28854 [Capsicum annuum]